MLLFRQISQIRRFIPILMHVIATLRGKTETGKHGTVFGNNWSPILEYRSVDVTLYGTRLMAPGLISFNVKFLIC
jgi:hypothetical protein